MSTESFTAVKHNSLHAFTVITLNNTTSHSSDNNYTMSPKTPPYLFLNNTHTHTPVLRPFVQEYPGGPVPER